MGMIGTGVKVGPAVGTAVGGETVGAGSKVALESGGKEVEVGDEVGRTVGAGVAAGVGCAVPRATVGEAGGPTVRTAVEVGVGDPPSEQATATAMIVVRRNATSPDARMKRRSSGGVYRISAFREEPA